MLPALLASIRDAPEDDKSDVKRQVQITRNGVKCRFHGHCRGHGEEFGSDRGSRDVSEIRQICPVLGVILIFFENGFLAQTIELEWFLILFFAFDRSATPG